jgi:glyoxylase-like metal-dependent hydrolase (beta-lactamase superfamily II)
MMRQRRIGAAEVCQIIEYTGPTHPPEFLFSAIPDAERRAGLNDAAAWLAPDHYVPRMDRLVVTIQLWLVKAGGNTILIDTGVGNHKPRPAERMNMLNTLVLPWLEAAGAGRDEVTHVVHTHLHTDHVGWNTVREGDRWVPTFPRARHLMPKPEYDYWRASFDAGDTAVNGGSFADSVLPVVDAGLAEMYDEGTRELAGCLVPEAAFGHAPGMFTLRLRSDGQEGLFTADAMHSPIQVVHPHWNDRYCLWPEKAATARQEVLRRASEREALIMPFHFGAPYCGYVRRQGEGFAFEPDRNWTTG